MLHNVLLTQTTNSHRKLSIDIFYKLRLLSNVLAAPYNLVCVVWIVYCFPVFDMRRVVVVNL